MTAADEKNAHTALASAHRAFLHKNYAQSLLESEQGLVLAKDSGEPDVLARTVILRYTVAVAIFTHSQVLERVLAELKNREDGGKAAALLDQPLGGLVASLWAESLRVFGGQAPEPPSLEATSETLTSALLLPTAVISSAILMALRADMALQGTNYARQLCEWYFAAVLAPEAPQVDMAQYQRVIRLYTVHVLGAHMHDWDYARSFVGYSRLTDVEKEALAADIAAAQARVDSRAARERAAAEHAQRQYEDKARSAKEDKKETDKNVKDALPAPAAPAPAQAYAPATAPATAPAPTPTPAPASKSTAEPATSASSAAPAEPATQPHAPTTAPSGTTLKRTTSIHARRPDAHKAAEYLNRRPNSDLGTGDKPNAHAPEGSASNLSYSAVNAVLRNNARLWDTMRIHAPFSMTMVLAAATVLPHAVRAVSTGYDASAVHELVKRKRVSLTDTIPARWAISFFAGVFGVFILFIIIGLLLKLINPPRAQSRHFAPPVRQGMRQASTRRTAGYGPSQSQVRLLDTQSQPYATPSYSYSDAPAAVPQPRIQHPAATYNYDEMDRADQRMVYPRGGYEYLPLRKASPMGFNMSANDLSQSSPSLEDSPFEVYESNAYSPVSLHAPTTVASVQPQRQSRGPLPLPPKRTPSATRTRNYYQQYAPQPTEVQGTAYSVYGAARPSRKASQRSTHSAVSRTSSQLSRVESIGAGDYRRSSRFDSGRYDRRRSQMTTAERLAALRAAAGNNEKRLARQSAHQSYDNSTTGHVIDAYAADTQDTWKPSVDFVKRLPRELAVIIFTKLSVRDVVHASLVSRHWHDVANDPSVWHALFLQHTWYLQLDTRHIGHEWRDLYMDWVELDRRWHLQSFNKHSGRFESFLPVNTYLDGHNGSIYCVTVDRCDAHKQDAILSGARDNTIKVWQDGRCIQQLDDHTGSVIALTARNGLVVSGSSDGTARVWRHAAGGYQLTHVLAGHRLGVLCVGFSDRYVVTGSRDLTVRVWSHDGALRHIFSEHCSSVNACHVYQEYAATGGGDGRIIIFDLATCSTVKVLEGPRCGIACIEYDGDHIITGNSDGYSPTRPPSTQDVPFHCPRGAGFMSKRPPINNPLMYEQGAPAPPPKPHRSAKEKFFGYRKGGAAKNAKAEPTPPSNIESITAAAQRLDVIDQLDISGIAGASLFHHDSPYDACSPYKNRSTKEAPIRAFGSEEGPQGGRALSRISKAPEGVVSLRNGPVIASEDSAGYFPNPIAEMWGESSEPWQEFSAVQEQARRAGYEPDRQSISDLPDMETILRGGSAKPDEQTYATAPTELAPVAQPQRRTGSSMTRSKSLVARLRRLKINPDEVNNTPDVPRRRNASLTDPLPDAPERSAYSSKGAARDAGPANILSTRERRQDRVPEPQYGGISASNSRGATTVVQASPDRPTRPRESRSARMSERTPASAILMPEPDAKEMSSSNSGSGMTRSKSIIGRLRSVRR
ncbi:hypothetical protein MCUN1_001262 [Malassezia cuniculi]|uniref:F-box domain-containing protein n=1 Tax=Malassezia cuniculi TaxID=948313 RepID=A0AAF0EU41_9BASI|nr:hypothetical protein MCUN1_001262 [Malassezia cuniculi]